MRLPTIYQEYIHLSRYARWDYDLKRRETWDETVGRYFNFFTEWLEEKNGYKLENGERVGLENAVKASLFKVSIAKSYKSGAVFKN